MIKVLIVDDELPARDELAFLLQKYPGFQIVGEAENGVTALEQVEQLNPDLVFLDIEMRLMNGYEAARQILNRPAPPLIVFATAYDTHAIEAFELGAVDYLLKPIEHVRLKNTLERVGKLREKAADWSQAVEQVKDLINGDKPRIKKIGLEKNGRISLIPFADIIYAEAQDKNVSVITTEGPLLYSGPLSELEGRLCSEHFLRVHRSYLVNLEQVTGVIPWFKGTYWLVLNNSEECKVPVSKSMVKRIKELLNIA